MGEGERKTRRAERDYNLDIPPNLPLQEGNIYIHTHTHTLTHTNINIYINIYIQRERVGG